MPILQLNFETKNDSTGGYFFFDSGIMLFAIGGIGLISFLLRFRNSRTERRRYACGLGFTKSMICFSLNFCLPNR